MVSSEMSNVGQIKFCFGSEAVSKCAQIWMLHCFGIVAKLGGAKDPETGWLTTLRTGRVRESKLSIAADLGAAEGVQKVYDIEGDVKVRDAHLTWSENADI